MLTDYPELLPPQRGLQVRAVDLIPGALYKVTSEVVDWLNTGATLADTPTYLLLRVETNVPSSVPGYRADVLHLLDLRNQCVTRSCAAYLPEDRKPPEVAFGDRGFYLISEPMPS